MFILWNYDDNSESGGFVLESFLYEEKSEVLIIKGNGTSYLKLTGSDTERFKNSLETALLKNHNIFAIEFPASSRNVK